MQTSDTKTLEDLDLLASLTFRVRRVGDHYALDIDIADRDGKQQLLSLRFDTLVGMRKFLMTARNQARAAATTAETLPGITVLTPPPPGFHPPYPAAYAGTCR